MKRIVTDSFFGEAATVAPPERRARLLGVVLAMLLAMYHGPPLIDSFDYGRDALYGALTHSLGIGPPPGEPLYILSLNAVSLLFGFLPLAMATHCFAGLVAGIAGFILYQICRTSFGARPITAFCVVCMVNLHPMLGALFRSHDSSQLIWLLLVTLFWAVLQAPRPGGRWQRGVLIALFGIGLFFGTTLGVSLLFPALLLAYLPRFRPIFVRPHLWLLGLLVMGAGMAAWYYPLARADSVTYIGAGIRPGSINALRNYWSASVSGDAAIWDLFVHPGPPLWAHLALAAIGLGPLGLLLILCGAKRIPRDMARLCTLLAVLHLLLIPSLSSNPQVRTWAKLIWIIAAVVPLALATERACKLSRYLPLILLSAFAAQQSLNARYQFINLEAWINCQTDSAYAAEIYFDDSRQWDFFCEELSSWNSGSFTRYALRRNNPFTQIDGQLWPYSTRRIVLLADGEMVPHFILHNRLHGGFAEVWLLENTESFRVSTRPERSESEIIPGAATMVGRMWPAWEVFVFSRDGTALPVQPPGAYYERMADWQLGGPTYVLWRLVPSDLFGPDI